MATAAVGASFASPGWEPWQRWRCARRTTTKRRVRRGRRAGATVEASVLAATAEKMFAANPGYPRVVYDMIREHLELDKGGQDSCGLQCRRPLPPQ